MLESNVRKFQEAMESYLSLKDEWARGMYEVYKAYQKAGFTKEESFELIKVIIRPLQMGDKL